MSLRPGRRLTLEIKLGADSQEAMLREIGEIVSLIKRGHYSSMSGGVDAGWNFGIIEIPDMTPEQYQAELGKYLDELAEEMKQDGVPV